MQKKYILISLIVLFVIFLPLINREKTDNQKPIIKQKTIEKNIDNDKEKNNNKPYSYVVKTTENYSKSNNSIKSVDSKSENIELKIYFNYNNNNNEEIKFKNVIYKKEYGILPIPEKEGYTFIGWYLDKKYTKKIDSTSIVDNKNDHTLYAYYKINSYLITFDYNYLENNLYKNLINKSLWNDNNFDIITNDKVFLNENVYKFKPNVNNFTLTYNEKINLKKDENYTFIVYIKTNNEKTLNIGFKEDLLNIKTNSSWQRFTKTFKAKDIDYNSFNFELADNFIWNKDDEIEIYGLMLHEGELNVKEYIKEYYEELGVLDDPKREGYIFGGWYTDLNFNNKISNDTIVEGANKTYYAKWIPEFYTLKINSEEGIYSDNKKAKEFKQGFGTIKELEIPKASYKITYNLNNSNAINTKNEDIVYKTFKGYVDEKNNIYSNTYIFNRNLELFASYDSSAKITLDTISKENYTCYWNTKKDGNGEKYNSNSTINIDKNMTLYGICESNIKFMRPLATGYLTSEYGYRVHPIDKTKKFHSGIDMSGPNKDVYSIAEGKVAQTGSNSSMGNYIIIHHNVNGQNYTSAYYHLDKKYVRKNQNVTQNTIIGKMGTTGASTGIHLHLTMYKGHLYNESTTMINPRDLVNFPKNMYNSWNDRTTYY